MVKKLKVLTIVGTRPEIIRLSRTLAKLDRDCDHTLLHTGQNYDPELKDVFFKDLELRGPDVTLQTAAAQPTETIANILKGVDEHMERSRPDAVLLLGDTNSCLSAYPAKRRKIPVFHMEAGNRCRDPRVPEELNRKIIDHIADINLPYSEHARQNLLAEGLSPDRVIKTGSPMKEVLDHYMPRILRSDALARFGLKAGEYFVASAHREENVDQEARLKKVVAVVSRVAETFGKPVIFSCHPRTKKRLDAYGLTFSPGVVLSKPLGFLDYVALQMHAAAVLSDSGTITEEAAVLGLSALNLRESHERPEGMEEAIAIMTGLNEERVLQALEVSQNQGWAKQKPLRLPADYDVDNVSDKVVRIVLSYRDYAERKGMGQP